MTYDVVAITDGTGAVVERFLYDPYGKSTVLDPNFAVDSDSLSDYDWETRFTSREFDKETGLDYFRARYYHSGVGRFVNRDPIGYISGPSLYAGFFAPNFRDPSGLQVGDSDQTYIDNEKERVAKERRNNEQERQREIDLRNENFEKLRERLYEQCRQMTASSEECPSEVNDCFNEADCLIDGLKDAYDKIDALGGPARFSFSGATCDVCMGCVESTTCSLSNGIDSYFNINNVHYDQSLPVGDHNWNEIVPKQIEDGITTVDYWSDDIRFWNEGRGGFSGYCGPWIPNRGEGIPYEEPDPVFPSGEGWPVIIIQP